MSPKERNDAISDLMFSVVIGTFNGSRTLGAALDALEIQVTDFSYEVIVVNDASTDSTPEIATRSSVRLINLESNHGHGHTLNVGLEEARGQIMAMMDDDCVPPPQWIQQLGLAWKVAGSEVTMIGGVVEPFAIDTFNRRYVEFRRPLRHQEAEVSESTGFWRRLRYQMTPPEMRSNPRAVYYTVGANMSVRVIAAREVGGFTEARGAGEEESLARSLRSVYGRNTVQLFPDIVMRHDFDASLWDTLRRSRKYGRAKGRDWVRDRDIPTLAPLPPLAAVVAVLVAMVSPALSLILLVLSPFVLYRRWLKWFRDRGSREAIIYPYIQAGEDLANDLGFVQGASRELRLRRRRTGS